MNKKIKCIFVVVSVICLLCPFYLNVYARNSNDYRNNSNWIDSSKDFIDSKYEKGDKFIVAYIRSDCENCKYVGTTVLTCWMNDYSYTVYGVDVDSQGINNWAREAAGGGTVALPLVVFVNNRETVALQGRNANAVDLLNETFSGFIKSKSPVGLTPVINAKSDSVYKRSVVTIIAKATDILSGYRLAIFDSDGNLLEKGNQFFIKYTVPDVIKKSQTIVIMIVNDEGLVFCDKEGNEISKKVEITVKNGFSDIIVAFFKYIFHSNEITISP